VSPQVADVTFDFSEKTVCEKMYEPVKPGEEEMGIIIIMCTKRCGCTCPRNLGEGEMGMRVDMRTNSNT
jgi:hypothetical protein